MLANIANSVFSTSLLAVGSDFSGGPKSTLFEEAVLGGVKENRLLGYVTAAGVLAGGPTYSPAATDVAVYQIGNSGPMHLRYVHNATGATIQLGAVVGIGLVADMSSVVLADATCPAGVALFDIPNATCAWVACGGVCEATVTATGAMAVGALLEVGTGGTAGTFVAAAAGTATPPTAILLDAIGGAGATTVTVMLTGGV